jgi:peptidoglycan/LPS O-acetylase OafA/YrhL
MNIASVGVHHRALDGLRGFAVLLVFFVHAAGNAAFVVWAVDFQSASAAALTSHAQRFLFWLYRSHHGVFLFFVLSGYLIAKMWLDPARMRYGRFAWRRTLRIYPAFLIAFAASLVFAYASGTWTPPDWPRLAGNLLFLNGAPTPGVAPFNVVTWSLFYEMTFYLVFPLLVLALRNRFAIAATGFVAPIVAAMLGADALVLCWSLLFAGVALAYAGDAWPRVPAMIVIIAYLTITTLAVLDALAPIVAIVAFGIAAAAIVALCVRGSNSVARLFGTAPLRALGRVSYSFYLVHWMIVVLVARAVADTAPAVATAAIFAGGFALSAIAATALWWVAERPYFAYARNIATRP